MKTQSNTLVLAFRQVVQASLFWLRITAGATRSEKVPAQIQ